MAIAMNEASLRSLVEKGIELIHSIEESGALSTLEEQFNSLILSFNEYKKEGFEFFIIMLVNNIKCAFEFAKNFRTLPLSHAQSTWFKREFSSFTAKFLELPPTILQKNRELFNTQINELVHKGQTFNMLELSLILVNYTKTAIENLSHKPANLANFYSILGLFKGYQKVIPNTHQEVLEYIGSILCFMRSSENLSEKQFENLKSIVIQIAKNSSIILNPLTSEEVKKDEFLALHDDFSKARAVLKEINFYNACALIEKIEIKRFMNQLNKTPSVSLFDPLFAGFNSSLIIFNVFRKNYERNSLNYLLFRSLIKAMNTVRDFMHKGDEKEKQKLITSLQSMGKELIAYIDNRKDDAMTTGVLKEPLRSNIFSFNKNYRDIISFAKNYAPKEFLQSAK